MKTCYYCEKEKAEMVQPCNTIQWAVQDHPARNSPRTEETGEAVERWPENINEWTGKTFAERRHLHTMVTDKKPWHDVPSCSAPTIPTGSVR